jgi:hypothetical protein
VFVTGTIARKPLQAYWTIAYNARTGAKRWSARYSGLGDSGATSVAASPDGSSVFVTGSTQKGNLLARIDTVAYSAATGARLWVARYRNGSSTRVLAALAPSASTLVVTGVRAVNGNPGQYVTLAYDMATGAARWTAIYQGPNTGASVPFAIAASPDGSRVFVTGQSADATAFTDDYATVAYRV